MKNWKIKQNNLSKDEIEKIQDRYNVHSLVAKFLASKNMTDEEEKIFLNPTRDDFYDPFLMPDMKKAVKRIKEALE